MNMFMFVFFFPTTLSYKTLLLQYYQKHFEILSMGAKRFIPVKALEISINHVQIEKMTIRQTLTAKITLEYI